MFGKVASDILGLSDIGTVIKPVDYHKVDADDYVMHEDGEKIYFLIKSKADEYCFTNLALIHLDGTSAMSKKRTLRRYSYATNQIMDVMLETAGTMDMDVEIKFKMGELTYSIDVHKNHISEVKDLYKALTKISEMTLENQLSMDYVKQSLDVASTTIGRLTKTESDVVTDFTNVKQAAFSWLEENRKKYLVKDFGFVFERYINN